MSMRVASTRKSRTTAMAGTLLGRLLDQRLRWLLAGLALLSLWALTGCGEADADRTLAASEPQPIAVGVSVMQYTVLHDILVLPGDTEAVADVVLSAERGGRVEWVGPREGQPVRQGEILAKVDLAALEAALRKAKASHALANEQYVRRKRLFEQRFISREELDKTETELHVAKSSLDEAQVAHDQGLIRSPIDGLVNKRHVDPGEFVGQGDPVLEVVNTELIDVRLGVPELDVRHLAMGQPVTVSVDAYPGQTWDGQVTFLSYKANPNTRTFTAKVQVRNDDGRIRPGMIARARLMRRMVPDALAVPLFVLQDRGGERLVYVEEAGVAKSRAVRLGIIEADRIQVLEGLSVGDRLIVNGHRMVEEGMKVIAR